MSKIGKQDSSSNTELITRKDVKDSPFVVIGDTEKKEFFGGMGKYRITEVKKTEQEVLDELSNINWNRIVQVCILLIDSLKTEK